jgi:transposase
MLGHPACIVAMEACGSSHYWARKMTQMGHEPRLIARRYVKPFVKRHKNDAADADAIVEAALRPTMYDPAGECIHSLGGRFVVPKTQGQQARAVFFRTRSLFICQRTEAVNALRAHLYEFGHIAPVGIQNGKQLVLVEEADSSELPEIVRFACKEAIEQIRRLTERLAVLDKAIARLAGGGAVARRLRTMPPLSGRQVYAAGQRGVGPITALAVGTFAPVMESFRCGRDFAPWLGLVPLQRSTDGKQILGKPLKMPSRRLQANVRRVTGQRGIRRLLIIGGMAVVGGAVRRGAPKGSWLEKMLARKPLMLVAIVLANNPLTHAGMCCRAVDGAGPLGHVDEK